MLHCREWFYNFAIVINKQKTMENEFFAEVKTLKHGFNAKRIGYKWGLYNDEGCILMRPLYDYISIDQEGRIWARYKGKKFFVEDDKLPYPFDFKHDSEIDKEWFVIESNGFLGVADKHLNVIIPMLYKYIIDYDGILWCSDKHICVDTEKGLKSAYLDCTLYSYKAERLTDNKFELFDSYSSYRISGHNQRIELTTCDGSVIKIPVRLPNKTNCNSNSSKVKMQGYSACETVIELQNSDYCSIIYDEKSPVQEMLHHNNEQIVANNVFHEGFSPVRKLGELGYKWGYLNEKGLVIIPFEYDDAKPFSDGLAAVKKDKLWGYIDYNNKVVIDFQFVEAGPFIEGLAKYNNNPFDHLSEPIDYGYISKDGIYFDRKYKWRNIDDAYDYDRSNRINYEEETWYAMTDGMYGDYTGSGFDYDTIGFGI